jgi:hypothetical protein
VQGLPPIVITGRFEKGPDKGPRKSPVTLIKTDTPIGPVFVEEMDSIVTETATGGVYVSNITFPPPISLSIG